MDEYADPFAKDAYRSWRDRQEAEPELVDRVFRNAYREAWQRGGRTRRHNVLMYLVLARVPEAIDIVWRALASKDPGIQATAAVAAVCYVESGTKPSKVQTARLRKVARSGIWSSTRGIALDALESADMPDVEGLLREVAVSDEAPDVRFSANLSLVRRGHRGLKRALLRDMRVSEKPLDQAFFLWRNGRLRLTAREEAELRRLIEPHLDELRKMALQREGREGWSYPILSLFVRIQNGFRSKDGDIDLLGALAMSGNPSRAMAVDALAWFDSARATDWLQRVVDSDQPEDVREAARRHLNGADEA